MSPNKPLFNADEENIFLNPYDVSLEPDKRKFKLFLVILGICSMFLFVGGLLILGRTLIENRMAESTIPNVIPGSTTEPDWVEIINYSQSVNGTLQYTYDGKNDTG